MSYLFVLVLVVLIATLFTLVPRWRRQQAVGTPFPADYAAILAHNIPVYRMLPDALKTQLHRRVLQFLHEKDFYGCGGLVITDLIRLTIAGEACLLILNRQTGVYPALRSILVYPTAFVATREEVGHGGVVTQRDAGLLGESWSTGKVILAWDNVQQGVRNFSDGRNVVLHEFAHQLDSESGDTNGAPILDGHASYRSWAQVLSEEYNDLRKDAHRQRQSLLDHYGATNPAEFFAVATETFFEQPRKMAEHHPELFEELQRFYRVNPAAWQPG